MQVGGEGMGTAYNTSDWLRSCPEKTFITNDEGK